MNSARLNVLADRGRRLGPAVPLSPLPEEVPLPDSVKLALTLGASAEGITIPEFVQRAICEKADRIGLPQLADSFARVPKTPDRESAEVSPPPRGTSARPFSAYGPWSRDAGCLAAVPDDSCLRADSANRFDGRDCGPPVVRRARAGQPRSGGSAVSEKESCGP